jgi:hypothetical protein
MRLCFIIGLFVLALAGVVQANDQQTQQACMNVATCLLAVKSGASVRRRWPYFARSQEKFAKHSMGHLARSASPLISYCFSETILRYLAGGRDSDQTAAHGGWWMEARSDHGRAPHAPASRLDYCRASSGPLSPAPMLHATSDTRVDLLLDLPCENLSALYLTRSIWAWRSAGA